MVSILLGLLDFTSVLVALGLGYYSVRMLSIMKWGKFESSWKFLATGASSLCIGYAFLTLEDFLTAYSLDYNFADYTGTILATIGIALLLVGMRQTYRVWHLSGIKTRAYKNSRDHHDIQNLER